MTKPPVFLNYIALSNDHKPIDENSLLPKLAPPHSTSTQHHTNYGNTVLWPKKAKKKDPRHRNQSLNQVSF